jgi:glycosyltransferase involved in cell wall biosynthesis
VCVSETTARDARALWGVPPERIVVAPHGPGQFDAPAARRTRPAHLLYVGDAEPRKNLPGLLAGYAGYRAAAIAAGREPLPLVLAGSGGAGGPEAGVAAAGPREWGGRAAVTRANPPGVRVEPRPDAGRLAELYAGACALVHAALHEGFGLSALEAMAAGVPVVAARAPGIGETCADAARWFDPRDPEALAAALLEVVRDARLRKRLAARGRARAARFSWERSARAHVEAYTLALTVKAPIRPSISRRTRGGGAARRTRSGGGAARHGQ